MKKRIGFLVGLLPVVGLQAQAPFHGGYGGLHGGLAHMKSNIDVDFGAGQNDFSTNALSDVNGSGGLHLGWHFAYGERWVFGLDARGEFSGINAEEKSAVNLGTLAQVRYEQKETYNLGLAAKIGYRLQKNALVYLKLGGRLSRFKFSYQDITNGVTAPTYSQNKTKIGFEPGLGVAFKLNECWSAFGEYSYTVYGSNKFENMDNSGGDQYPFADIKPEIGRFTLGVSYHF